MAYYNYVGAIKDCFGKLMNEDVLDAYAFLDEMRRLIRIMDGEPAASREREACAAYLEAVGTVGGTTHPILSAAADALRRGAHLPIPDPEGA